jgi:hypothetical protein
MGLTQTAEKKRGSQRPGRGVSGSQQATMPQPVPDCGASSPEVDARCLALTVRWSARCRLPSLISSLIHVRVPPFTNGQHPVPSRLEDKYSHPWTGILNTEKRKVGGSTPPLTTYDLLERAA